VYFDRNRDGFNSVDSAAKCFYQHAGKVTGKDRRPRLKKRLRMFLFGVMP
jgi:hypothetical protein